MQTLSTYITIIDEDDKDLHYFDDLSIIIMQVAKNLRLYGDVIVEVADIFGTDEFKLSQMNKLVDLYGDGCLLVSMVEISPNEFEPTEVCTEETVEKIQEALLRDCKIMEEAGMVKLEYTNLEKYNEIPYIYPNDIGKAVMMYMKLNHEHLIKVNEVQ